MIGGRNGNRMGNPSAARDHGQEAVGDRSGALPGVQFYQAQQDRPLPERHFQAGRRGVALLALPVAGRGVV